MDGQSKITLLRHCIGQDGQAVNRAIKDPPPPAAGEPKFEKATDRLDKRFAKNKGLAAALFKFAGRSPQPGESVRDFVSVLIRLTKKGKFPISAEDAVIT